MTAPRPYPAPRPDHDDAVPLCLHCLNPVSPLAYTCPTCAHSSGQFTTYLPFEQIPFFAECMGGLWRRFWFGRGRSVGHRLFCLFLIGASYPWMFLAAPIALWQLASGHRPERPSGPLTRPA
jgi:hypothetical protein